ncbi:hypothetical protein N7490_002465 [Penicillium lividum]|nr:hypothetical protein N7490_002465 [Penicillium lividum]
MTPGLRRLDPRGRPIQIPGLARSMADLWRTERVQYATSACGGDDADWNNYESMIVDTNR